MTNIAWLEKQIGSAERALGDRRSQDEENLADQLSLASLEHHLNELRTELREAQEERNLEVLDLGVDLPQDPAKDGSLPLDFLAKISSFLAKFIYSIGRFEERGTFGGQIPDEIKTSMDLRLTSIKAGGSTHLLITGQTAPDLFGRSLLATSLRTAFEILNSEDPESLISAATDAGPRGVAHLSGFLRTIQKAEATSTLQWESPSGVTRRWKGDKPAVDRLTSSLATLERLTPETLELAGEIVTLSTRRQFELAVPGEDAPMTARVPQAMLGTLEDFRVGQRVEARVSQQVVRNRITGASREHLVLEELRPL